MRAVLLFIIIYCVIFKKGIVCAISPQSIFFVSSLVRSGIFPKSRSKDRSLPVRRSIISGAIYIMLGFIVSTVLLNFTPVQNRLYYLQLAFITACLYFCFYSFVIIMYQEKKAQRTLKLITTLCTVAPCISAISGIQNTSSEISAILLTLGAILFYITLYKTKRMS